MSRFVVIGGGHAAGQAVASLRQDGFDGEIDVVGDEPHLPYQRPPLSKQYLSGEHSIDRVYLRAAAFYEERKITLHLGVRGGAHRSESPHRDAVDRRNDPVRQTADRHRQSRPAPQHSRQRSDRHPLPAHRRADVDAIRAGFGPARRSSIAGGGYIGLEVASVAVTSGLDVTVLEMEERILKRVTTPAMSAFYHGLHTGRGVMIRTSTKVSGFAGKDGHVEAVLTESGERIPADLVHRRYRNHSEHRTRVGAQASHATTASSSTTTAAPPIPTSTPPATARIIRTRCSDGACASRACRTRWSRRALPPRT